MHHGRVVKRTGDGSIIEFRSVVDAVRCAIEIQIGMVEGEMLACPQKKRIEFRVGIHLGDVVEESDGDLMGDGVNIAARLESIAKPGAICLSEDAYRQVTGRVSRSATSAQPNSRTSPNRSASIRLASAIPRRRSTRQGHPEKSIPPRLSMVVLPFANIGGGPEQEHFVDGVTDRLTTDLRVLEALS